MAAVQAALTRSAIISTDALSDATFTNEAPSAASDAHTRGGNSGTSRGRCFNTSSLVEYTHDLVGVVRSIDASRPISSGFSLARPTAWHQEACIAGSNPRLCGAIDSRRQWQEMLLRQHEAVDIISAHAYAGLRGCYFEGFRSRLGCRRQGNVSVLHAAAEAAASVGKPLYVGEFGGPSPNFTGPSPSSQAFPEAVLRWQAERRPHVLSSIWAWGCPSHRTQMHCVSASPRQMADANTSDAPTQDAGPGSSARMLALLQAAERQVTPWGFCKRATGWRACTKGRPGLWPR